MMGAYFIRRRSRGALYRRVLARYVQMATAGGVSQGIFPEGGLSLTGGVMPPKLGLLSYLTEGFDPEGRDIVFVPVAINYDRVLEDRVLIAAGQRGDRRFGARITVVARFMLAKLWQAARGRYIRFGAAAVAFGEPLSLRNFGAKQPVEALARDLMQRIEVVMPALVVPLICRSLVERGAATEPQVTEDVRDAAQDLPQQSLVVSGAALVQDVTAALERMRKHGMIEKGQDGWRIVQGEEATVAYYARSIAPLFPLRSAAAE